MKTNAVKQNLFPDWSARTLAGSCIGSSSLPSERHISPMTYASVATQVHQALDVHIDRPSEVAFHH